MNGSALRKLLAISFPIKLPLVKQAVLRQIAQVFQQGKTEQGFLLGCTTAWNILDRCSELPSIHAGRHFYTPNAEEADRIIRQWADQDICFCGMIHSHLVDKANLSENDVDYAKRLFKAYALPVMWFGIGIVQGEETLYRFYSVRNCNGVTCVLPTEMETIN